MRFTPWAMAAFAASALYSATPTFAAEDLGKQLGSSNPAEASAAAEALAEQSPAQLKALLPALTKALESKQWSVRQAVLAAFPRLGPALKSTLPAVTARLEDAEPVVQAEALIVLQRIGVDAASAAPAVTKLLASQDAFVRTEAAVTLTKIAPEDKAAQQKSLAALSALATSDDALLRNEVIDAFVDIGDGALPTLTTLLASTDNRAAALAADALEGFGPLGRGATTALVAQLDRPDKNVVVRAARALGSIGSAAKTATQPLIAKLGDESPMVRAYAARALGKLGDEAAATPALIALTKDKDPAVARVALAAIDELHPDPAALTQEQIKAYMPAVLEAVESPNPEVRSHAMRGVAATGEAAIPALIESLAVPGRRHAACIALAELGPKAKSAVEPLAKATEDEDPSTRMQAFVALAAIGPDAKPATKSIVKGLDDAQPSVKYAAVFAAGRLAEDADKSTSGKLEALAAQDKDEFLKTVATWALAKINPDDDKRLDAAVTLLAKGLTSKEPRRRSASLLGLVELKPAPEVLIPAVLAALKDADPKDAPNVIAALAEFGPLPAPLLLGVDQPGLRQQVLLLLARQKAAPVLLVPVLTKAIEVEKDEEDQGELLLALANYGADAKPAVQLVLKVLADETAGLTVRRRAAYALGKIGADAWAAQPELEKLLKSDEQGLRVAAAWALASIAPKSKESIALATPILIEGLNDSRPLMKIELAEALGRLGSEAKSAVPALRKLATESDPEVSKAAAEALEKIQP